MGLAKKLVQYKLYLGRANSYIIIINTGMLLLLFISKLKEYGIVFSITKYGIPLFIITIIIFIFIGYLDEHLGIFKYETSLVQKNNLEIQKINNDLEEIKKLIKEKKMN